MIHVIPFAISAKFYNQVQLRHAIQAVIYERVYFLTIEGRLIGDGSRANDIYALSPPCGPELFESLQMLSTISYFIGATVCASTRSQRQFLQVIWLTLFLFVAYTRSAMHEQNKKTKLLHDTNFSKCFSTRVSTPSTVATNQSVVDDPIETMSLHRLDKIIVSMRKTLADFP